METHAADQTRARLVSKLVRIMESVDHVEKRGRNEKQNYDFVRAADLYHEIRKAFIENNVFMTCDVVSQERWTQPTQAGGTMNLCSLRVAFTFHDGESGATIGPVHGCGWGSDVGDKSVYKALTGALKYAGRMNFVVPDDADPEEDGAPRTARPSPPARSSAQQARPPAPVAPKPEGKAATPADAGRKTGISEGQRRRLFALCKEFSLNPDCLKDYILKTYGFVSTRDISRDRYESICAWLRGK